MSFLGATEFSMLSGLEGLTQTQVISKQIAEKAANAQIEFLETVITEFDNCENRKLMDVADKYYRNKGDILEEKRMVISKDQNNEPVLVESKVLSNNRLAHNYMKKLTRQKIAYMLGRPFILTSVKASDDKVEEFFDKVSAYFTDDFYKKIKNIGRDSVVKGIGWIMVYYNEAGQLRFMRCNSEDIIPLWSDSDHTDLDAVIRKYKVEEYRGGQKVVRKFIEYYTHEGVFYYKYDDLTGKLVFNQSTTEANPYFHIKPADAKEEDEAEGVIWKTIPFIPFKYDPDEQSLLTRIKTLVDDYDKKTSSCANAIDDFPNSVTVVKNYDGASKEEFVKNKNEYRTIFVQGDGDAKALDAKLDLKDTELHLARLRQDIYEFGQGVNTADKDIRDTSGVALRFIYADLDMDCVDWGSEFEWSLKRLIWFIQKDIELKTGVDYSSEKYSIMFNTDVIINETETITNCMNSKGVVSDETIAANHPWPLNAKKEIDAMRADTKFDLSLESQYGNGANK